MLIEERCTWPVRAVLLGGGESLLTSYQISYDEGRTWEDEVYYLNWTAWGGSYNASVVLDEDLLLTIIGSSGTGEALAATTGSSEFTAIRWKPRRD